MTRKQGLTILGVLALLAVVFVFGPYLFETEPVQAAMPVKYNPPTEIVESGSHMVVGKIEGVHLYQERDSDLAEIGRHPLPAYTLIEFFGSDERLRLCGDHRSGIALGADYTFVVIDTNRSEYDNCFDKFHMER